MAPRLFIKSICSALILSASLVQAAPSDTAIKNREKIAENYQQVVKKTDRAEISVIVTFKNTGATDKRQIRQATKGSVDRLEKLGLSPTRVFKRLGSAVYNVTTDELNTLLDSGEVESLKEDKINKPNLGDSVPFILGSGVHSAGFTGQGSTIVVIDTGVDSTHPDLSGKVVQEACFSTNNAAAKSKSLCPSGQNTQFGSGAARNCSVDKNQDCFHGTYIASIAAGKQGVAPGADIIAVQAFSEIDGKINGWDSDLIAAMEWVLETAENRDITAVNMSLGQGEAYYGTCNDTVIAQIISELREMGVATVTSSGNSGFDRQVGSPACVGDAIAVGGTQKNSNGMYIDSNSSYAVDVLAPAVDIWGAYPGNRQAQTSGTSQAAAHVSGAIAIMKQINPQASVTMMENWLEAHGRRIGDPNSGLILPRIDLIGVQNNFDNHKNILSDFEGNRLGSWRQASNDTVNWTFRQGKTTSYGTGPIGPDTGKTYLYMETSYGHANKSGNTASLVSPIIYGTQRSLVFDYHMYGADTGILAVEIKTASSSSWQGIWRQERQQHEAENEPWATATIDLSRYSGGLNVRIRGIARGGYRGDIAIDNVNILGEGLYSRSGIISTQPTVKYCDWQYSWSGPTSGGGGIWGPKVDGKSCSTKNHGQVINKNDGSTSYRFVCSCR